MNFSPANSNHKAETYLFVALIAVAAFLFIPLADDTFSLPEPFSTAGHIRDFEDPIALSAWSRFDGT